MLFIRAVRFIATLGLMLCVALAVPVQAADRDRLIAFLDVTGFDVALDSIALTAASAPQMLGLENNAYGAEWRQMADAVFERSVMHEMALTIMEPALDDETLAHGAAFYASDLGQRLVAAENQSHMDDSTEKDAVGRNLVLDMTRQKAPRQDLLRRLNKAVDPQDIGVKAVQEIQVRFLMAAAAAGIARMDMGEDELRAVLANAAEAMKAELDEIALAESAFAYRDFSDDEIAEYAQALEHPRMTALYELMNAVQYEIMADRFEVLAWRMSELHPSQEL